MKMVSFRSRAGLSIPALVLFAVSLLHFLIIGPQNLLLKDLRISILIISLFIAQSLLLKHFLGASNIKKGNSSVSQSVANISILQPLAFSLIFLSIQILTIHLRGIESFLLLIEDPQSFGYYSLALNISDPLTYLREWLALMQVPLLYWGGHLATHLPGYPFMIYFGFHLFGSNPRSVSWLVILLSTLTLFPLFYLAKFVHGHRAATITCTFYTWIPSVSLGLPYMELTLSIFTTTALLLFIRSLGPKGKASRSILGGLTLSFAAFLTFVSTSLLVLATILAVSRGAWQRALLRVFYFISAALVPYLFLGLALRLPLYEAVMWALRTHNWFYHHLHSLRPEIWSIEISTLFFFLLLGLPTCILFLVTVFRACASSLRHTEVDKFTLAFSTMLLVVILLARLELARVALFALPMLVTCVAGTVIRSKPEGSLYRNCLLLSLAQFLETFSYLSQSGILSGMLGYPVV